MWAATRIAVMAGIIGQTLGGWVIKNTDFATIALSVDFVTDEEGYVPAVDSGSGAAELKTVVAGAKRKFVQGLVK